MKGRFIGHIMLGLTFAFTGCTGMKHVTSVDPMYVGHKIKMRGKAEGKGKLQSIAQKMVQPNPNKKTLWMRPAVARYNMLSDSAKQKKFWKSKVSPPVVSSEVSPHIITRAIQDRMFHNGYFNSRVTFDTMRVGKRKMKYVYEVELLEPYKYDTIRYPKPDSPLAKEINAITGESLLHSGDVYTLDLVKAERNRIDNTLKERGYFFFSPDFLLLKADSVSGEHQLKGALTINPMTPPESRVPFRIRNVYIHDDIALNDERTDTIQKENYYLLSDEKNLAFEAILRGLFLQPGTLYSRTDHLHTLRYFNDLPLIRNANMKFVSVADSNELDLLMYLTHRKRFAYTVEVNTVFRSTNYFGPGVVVSYSDRNAKRGAELLKINLRGSFEMQIVEQTVNLAYELGLGIEYTIPRFFPRVFENATKRSLPKTVLSAGYNLFNRLDLYRLNSLVLNIGYRWSRTDRINHLLTPLELIFTSLPESSKSQKFKDYLEENPGVQRSFDEQFLMGTGYEILYQSPAKRQNQWYIRGGLDAAGNFLNLLYSGTNASKDTLGRYILFGVPFSQYIRPQFDIRYDAYMGNHSNIVSRFSAGVGIPIGNSSILPYIKQFYVGGTNSLRSFIARSVGPGSQAPPEGYNDITGDIRLEANLEYRIHLAGSLHGALFVDAGNVWLFNKDETRPDGHFRFSTFLDQIAMSVGWGLRWDFDFVVARLDFAYTARTPYLPEGERWAKRLNIWKPTINFAIGYPF